MDRCLIYVQRENKYHEQCVHNLMQIEEALESFVIYSNLFFAPAKPSSLLSRFMNLILSHRAEKETFA